ncbi:MAG: glycosyl transferase group 1 [Acidimicrobiales bacterium]|nr:glycosyl transferase group 1 [Acidimicrobiales bacterium]
MDGAPDMRVCIVYDCLFPWTIGGAERWYRGVAEELARRGHEVTYLTLRQWPRSTPPSIPGVRVVAVGNRLRLYTPSGRRRTLPPIVFGIGVLAHLLRRSSRYDVVHSASFPFFSVLAAAALRRWRRYRLVVDWFELWSKAYWTEYLGRVGGLIGWLVQRRCLRARQQAFCFSQVVAEAVRAGRVNGEVTVLRGLYSGPHAGDPTYREPPPAAVPPRVVFAGRHIPEKRLPALIAAVQLARTSVSGLELDVFGDGPDRVRTIGCDAVVSHGVVPNEMVHDAFRSATCLVLASTREGYGLVCVEAAAVGCPVVVVAAPQNAAVELVEEGLNGAVAPSADADELARAIIRVVAAGYDLRQSTARWYAAHSHELALVTSVEKVVAAYDR